MLTKHYRQQLQKCLREQGIFGQPAARLLEELDDHFYAALDSLRTDANNKPVAQRLAWEILGRPEVIAASAAEASLQGFWAARRPLIFAAMLFVLVFVFNTVASLGFWIAMDSLDLVNLATANQVVVKLLNFTFTWGPQVLSLGLVGFLAFRYPLGWRSLLSASAAVGFATAILDFHVNPSHGPKSGGVEIILEPVSTTVASLIGLCHDQTHFDLALLRNLFHLFFPFALCLMAKYSLERIRTASHLIWKSL